METYKVSRKIKNQGVIILRHLVSIDETQIVIQYLHERVSFITRREISFKAWNKAILDYLKSGNALPDKFLIQVRVSSTEVALYCASCNYHIDLSDETCDGNNFYWKRIHTAVRNYAKGDKNEDVAGNV